jgi:hypothetical protein
MIMKMQNTCPLCCKALGPEEKLAAEYIRGQDWWRIEHVRVSTRGEPDHVICSAAGFQFDHRIDLDGRGIVMESSGAGNGACQHAAGGL